MPRSASRATTIRRSIQVGAPPAKVYDAFRTDASLSAWYMDGTTVHFAPGGSISFDGPEGSVRAVIRDLVDDRRIVLDYQPPWWGAVTWEITPSTKGSRVLLLHEGFEGREEWLERFTWGWESFLKGLKAYVEGDVVP